MKRLKCFFMLALMAVNVFPQSLEDLERDPSFKGITIGAPISKYSDILTFSHTSEGKNIYRVTQSSYLSIFNIRMQEMRVMENKGKVYAISLTKSYPADNDGAMMFNTNDLLSWYSNLRSKYGNNSFSLGDMTGTPTVCGMRWKTTSVILDIVYLFYGTFGNERPQLKYFLYQREDDY